MAPNIAANKQSANRVDFVSVRLPELDSPDAVDCNREWKFVLYVLEAVLEVMLSGRKGYATAFTFLTIDHLHSSLTGTNAHIFAWRIGDEGAGIESTFR